MNSRIIYQHYQINKLIRQNNISLIEYLILDFLLSGGNITPTKLSDYLKVSMPAVVLPIETLANEGYVERSNSKDDRRITYIKITDKGNEYLSKIVKRMKDAGI